MGPPSGFIRAYGRAPWYLGVLVVSPEDTLLVAGRAAAVHAWRMVATCRSAP